ncbi:MAG: C45 family autoproteolytic acyltransferase/hydrolase [Bdellovibrionota bacterium]|nr:MAG: C45 family autoproteolytic acyltransferase/hydrolase [Bdellovibrionota bacterium]
MKRRLFVKGVASSLPLALTGCVLGRIDFTHYRLRSDRFKDALEEAALRGRAQSTWTDDGRIRVLFVTGDGYERGYQQGALLRDEVRENILYMYEQAVEKFYSAEIFAEAYERLRPFIPQEYVDEMHGLAHGAKLPLDVVHHFHALPSVSEWGGKKKLRDIAKKMFKGIPESEWGTSCSNLCAHPESTVDGGMYVVRILDWGLHRISKLHDYPLITVNVPSKGYAHCNIGWVGFLGAVSGMNEQGITLGEMGYGDPPNETLRGKPMPFLLREVMQYAKSLPEVRNIIQGSPGTNSFVYLMSDGKSRQAELYVRDRDRFLVFQAGDAVEDTEKTMPPIPGIVYGGHYDERMAQRLAEERGKISPQLLMDKLIPEFAMASNFQNVVYDPIHLRFWVNNAKSHGERAAEQPYTLFDLKSALSHFRKMDTQ